MTPESNVSDSTRSSRPLLVARGTTARSAPDGGMHPEPQLVDATAREPRSPLTVRTASLASSAPVVAISSVGLLRNMIDSIKRRWIPVFATLIVAGSAYAAPNALVLRGVDSQDARPFRLATDSDVFWSCPGCAGSAFLMSTDRGLPVNSLGPTAGRSFLERGRYRRVSVTAVGAWKITIRRAEPRPVRPSYVLTGVESMNVRPFTLTHGSTLTWSCARCQGSNFVVSTDQDIPVNAVGRARGKSFLAKGRYTGVSITARGRWKIILR